MGGNLDIWSIISAKDGKPYVQFKFDEEHKFQMTPDEAREHAARIIEVAFGAEADAFIVDFLTTRIGAEREISIRVLQDLREWREGKKSKSDQMRWRSFNEQTKGHKPDCQCEICRPKHG